MPLSIKPYTEDLIPAVKEFNRRVAGAVTSEDFLFPEQHVPRWLPKSNEPDLYQEYFVAVEKGKVRGAFCLKHQDFLLRGEMRQVAYYHMPLSEGLVNREYAGVGAQMLRHALKTHPLVFALGMGSFTNPLPRMLKAMGWSMYAVPFFFRVHHPARFMREMRALQGTPAKRLAMNLARISGTAWAGIYVLQRMRARKPAGYSSIGIQRVECFSKWADELWEQSKSRYMMAGDRRSSALDVLYPPGDNRFLRVKVLNKGEPVGWSILMDTQMRNDKYFGNLRVGTIADGLALPENAARVVQASTSMLEERGVDLIVSNQSHIAWMEGLKKAGFLRGPSNYIFAASKKLGEILTPFDSAQTQIHFTRGDGDGPIHL